MVLSLHTGRILVLLTTMKTKENKGRKSHFVAGSFWIRRSLKYLADTQVQLTSKLYWEDCSSGESGVWERSGKRQFQGREVDRVLIVILYFFPVIIFYSEWKIVLNVPSKRVIEEGRYLQTVYSTFMPMDLKVQSSAMDYGGKSWNMDLQYRSG